MLLHELTHGYHFRDQARIDALAQQVYEKVKQKYLNVRYCHGQFLQAYAYTDFKEYLAEITEAFFSSKKFRNDYFPFVRSQLREYDLDGYELVKSVFQIEAGWIESQIEELPADFDMERQVRRKDEDIKKTY